MDYFTNFINYLEATKNLSQKTIAAYKSDIKQFITYENEICNPDICAFISYLRSDIKLKDASICRKIITLKNFYNYLLNNNLITTSPFTKIKFKFKQEKSFPKHLPFLILKKLFNVLISIRRP